MLEKMWLHIIPQALADEIRTGEARVAHHRRDLADSDRPREQRAANVVRRISNDLRRNNYGPMIAAALKK